MPAALRLDDVCAGYGRIRILHHLSLTVPEGTVVALIGPNGAGKTTTMRTIAGLLPLQQGSIHLGDRRIDNLRPSKIAAAGVTLIPEGRGIFPGLSVEENLRIAHRAAPAEAAGTFDDFLADLVSTFPRLGERLTQVAGSMSGGEQQMLAISRALVGSPRLVLFDELSMGLAPLIVEQLFEQVHALRDRGVTIVLVEQFLTHALRYADLCYVLAKGSVAWAGEAAELRRDPSVAGLLAS